MNLKVLLSTLIILSAFPAMGGIDKFAQTATVKVSGRTKNAGFNNKKKILVKRPLRRILRQQDLTFNEYKVKNIIVYAKTRRGANRFGQGKVIFNNGGQRKVMKAPAVSHNRYIKGRPGSYKKMFFRVPGGTLKNGAFLRLRGVVKVLKVEALLKSKMEVVTIPLGGQKYGNLFPRQQPTKIKLKQKLKEQWINPKNYTMIALKIKGKSRNGGGKAKLMIGRQSVSMVTLPQAQYGTTFRSNELASYSDQLIDDIEVPGLGTGAWQLHFKGKNKVKNVKLLLIPN